MDFLGELCVTVVKYSLNPYSLQGEASSLIRDRLTCSAGNGIFGPATRAQVINTFALRVFIHENAKTALRAFLRNRPVPCRVITFGIIAASEKQAAPPCLSLDELAVAALARAHDAGRY
jgi:hypothetical protein